MRSPSSALEIVKGNERHQHPAGSVGFPQNLQGGPTQIAAAAHVACAQRGHRQQDIDGRPRTWHADVDIGVDHGCHGLRVGDVTSEQQSRDEGLRHPDPCLAEHELAAGKVVGLAGRVADVSDAVGVTVAGDQRPHAAQPPHRVGQFVSMGLFGPGQSHVDLTGADLEQRERRRQGRDCRRVVGGVDLVTHDRYGRVRPGEGPEVVRSAGHDHLLSIG